MFDSTEESFRIREDLELLAWLSRAIVAFDVDNNRRSLERVIVESDNQLETR